MNDEVTLGEHNREKKGEGKLPELRIGVKKAVLHGDQESNPSNSDVAILYLAKEVDLTTYTPVCLPSSSDTTAFDGKTALAVGELMTIEQSGELEVRDSDHDVADASSLMP